MPNHPNMIHLPNGIWVPRNLQQREFPPTVFNACLDVERRQWEQINRIGGITAICPGRKWTEPPWIRMPVQGKRFTKPGSIAMPAANGTDNLVVSWVVPLGYDGVITSLVFQTTSGVTNYVEGSGDLIWRLRINQRWVRDYGNVKTTLGSMQTPYGAANLGGILIQSGQLIQNFVVNATGSSVTGGRIIMANFGWFWPR